MATFDEAVASAIERWERESGAAVTPRQAERLFEDVFFEWLDAGPLDGLIAVLHARYPSSGGFELTRLLRMSLEEAGRAEAIHRLFGPLVRGRIRRFWREWPHAEEGHVGNIALAAEARASALVLMEDWFQCMYRMGDRGAAERLAGDIRLLHAQQRRPLPPLDDRAMTEERFWAIIERARGGPDGMVGFVDALEEALLACPGEALAEFQRRLLSAVARLASHDLWALAYLARGGCSDDAFDDFRAWIVAQGRAAVEAAERGPEALVQAVRLDGDLGCEELLHAAGEAYERREGRPMPSVRGPKTVWTGRKWKEKTLERTHGALRALLDAQRA